MQKVADQGYASQCLAGGLAGAGLAFDQQALAVEQGQRRQMFLVLQLDDLHAFATRQCLDRKSVV